MKDASDADGTAYTIEAQFDHVVVVRVLDSNAKSGQRGRPSKLEHWHDVLAMFSAGEIGGGSVVDTFHKRTGCLGHLLYFHVEQQASLLF